MQKHYRCPNGVKSIADDPILRELHLAIWCISIVFVTENNWVHLRTHLVSSFYRVIDTAGRERHKDFGNAHSIILWIMRTFRRKWSGEIFKYIGRYLRIYNFEFFSSELKKSGNFNFFCCSLPYAYAYALIRPPFF